MNEKRNSFRVCDGRGTDDFNVGGEIVGELVGGECGFAEEGGVPCSRDFQTKLMAAVDGVGIVAGPGGVAKVFGRADRSPSQDLDGFLVAGEMERQDVVSGVEFPIEFGQFEFARDMALEGADRADEPCMVAKIVTVVGNVEDVLLTDETIPIQVQSIQRPVAVVGPEQDQLGLSQRLTIGVGIDNAEQLLAAGRSDVLLNAAAGIVFDLLRVAAPSGDLVSHLRPHVERVDDHGGERFDAPVNGRREPGGPAALRGAGEREVLDVELPFFLAEGLDRVHRSNDAFDHRQEERPGGIFSAEELLEGVGDDLVLNHAAKDRLLRDLQQDGNGGLNLRCHGGDKVDFARKIRVRGGSRLGECVGPVSAADQQKGARGVADLCGFVEKQLMLPDDAFPDLRCERQLDVVAAGEFSFAALGPSKTGVGPGDVIGERAAGIVGFEVGATAQQGETGGDREWFLHEYNPLFCIARIRGFSDETVCNFHRLL